jgi:ribosome-associated toxin RatA of RatAB toxin-antitoxin module
MPCIERQAFVPYSPQAMFDLVAAVERYPQFLPWCASSQILLRRDDGIDASLQVRFKGIQQHFSTRNIHRPPGLIQMQLLDGPFERLEGAWYFDGIEVGDDHSPGLDTAPKNQSLSENEPSSLQGCKVRLRLDYHMKSGLLARLFSPAFDMIAAQMMDAFLARADQCYGV